MAKKGKKAPSDGEGSGSPAQPEAPAPVAAAKPAKAKTPAKKANDKKSAAQAKRDIERAEKIKEALDFRRMGYSYQEIADAMEISKTTAFEYVKAGIADIPKESAEEVRDLEVQRLDKMLARFMEVFDDAPNREAVEIILKLQDRRSQYLGLYAAPLQAADPMTQFAKSAGEKYGEMLAADRPILAPDAPIPANPVL